MKYIFAGLFFFLLSSFQSPSFHLAAKAAQLDPSLAQALSPNSVIFTRQISIPGYPKAYNPSLIWYEDGYLLSFRAGKSFSSKERRRLRSRASFIGLVKLDKRYNVSRESVQLLEVESYSNQVSSTAEDARLFTIGNRIFIFFNDVPISQKPGEFALYFGELIEKKGGFVFKEYPRMLCYFKAGCIEKNWSPFFANDNLYVIYSDKPRIILHVDVNTGICSEIGVADSNLDWDWGLIRGGTPAYLVGDQFLTFFHSSFPAPGQGLNYVMGAYAFDKEFPFTIRSVVKAPLGELWDYEHNNATKVVFPGGMVVDDRFVRVAWGKNDRQIFITTFDKQKLFAEMKTRLKDGFSGLFLQ